MSIKIVVGAQWGDEGKGKIVDFFAEKASWVVRFHGGNNAGHTILVNDQKFVLHLLPSGIFQKKNCVVGSDVVVNPTVFMKEVEYVKTVFPGWEIEKHLFLSEKAHIILPYHERLDAIRESNKNDKFHIGTTKKGIGPCFEDKASRRGIRVQDLFDPELLSSKITLSLKEKNALFTGIYGEEETTFAEIYDYCMSLALKLKPFVTDTEKKLREAIAKNEEVLFEGAQGILLDNASNDYPFVTSSRTLPANALMQLGNALNKPKQIIGVTKAYCTRVGSGPFATELEFTNPTLAEEIRKIGHEYGATTGRNRRVGWLDLVSLKEVVEEAGLTEVIITKVDVLKDLESVFVCTEYKNGTPVLKEFKSWPELAGTYANIKSLPTTLTTYLSFVESYLGIPVTAVGIGRNRHEIVLA